jgi:uncharacterized protein YndB with AHSA1/START domain
LRSIRLAVLLFVPLAGIVGVAGVAGIAPATESQRSPTAEEARRLDAGEVLVEVAEPPGGGPGEGVGRGRIDAPPERVFAALADLAHHQEWMPFVTHSDARLEAGGAVVSAQTLHLPTFLGDRSYRIRAVSGVEEGKAGRIWTVRWTYVPGSGNVVDTHGSWSVVEWVGARKAGGGRRSLVTCRMFLDPGHVSGFAMDRAMRKNLVWIFAGLRQQVRRGRYLKY